MGFLSSIDIMLDSNEKIIWEDKTDKRPVILSVLGGVVPKVRFDGIESWKKSSEQANKQKYNTMPGLN